MVDKTSILALIARRPNIRTVEIADLVDCDLEQVQPAIQMYITKGDILVEEIRAPNGRMQPAYQCSAAFMKSDLYKTLLQAKVLEEPKVEHPKPTPTLTPVTTPHHTPPPTPVPTPVCTPKPAFVDTTALPKPLGKGKSYVEKAIDALVAKGGKGISVDDMRTELGLARNQYPSSYLAPAIRDNRIKVTNGFWELGAKLKHLLREPGALVATALVDKQYPSAANIPVLAGDKKVGTATLSGDGKASMTVTDEATIAQIKGGAMPSMGIGAFVAKDTELKTSDSKAIEMVNTKSADTTIEGESAVGKCYAPSTKSQFGFAFWNTGELSILKNGVEIKLSKDEVDDLCIHLKQ